MKMVKVTTPEYLSRDIMDEEFLQAFRFHHRLQYFLGSSRINAKDRFVTPPSTPQKVYTIFCVLSALSLVLIIFSKMYKNFDETTPINKVLTYSNLFALIVPCTCNVMHVRFLNNNKNVEFLVELQKSDRILQQNTLKSLSSLLLATIIFPLTWLFIVVGFLLITLFSQIGLDGILFLGPIYLIFTLMLEIGNHSIIVSYFWLRIVYTNCLIEKHLVEKPLIIKKPSLCRTRKYVRYHVEHGVNTFGNTNLCLYLRELFVSFERYQGLYRFQLFIFCTQTVLSSVLSFGLVLGTIPNKENLFIEAFKYAVQTIVQVGMSVSLAIRYDLFFSELKKTKRLCVSVMARHTEGPLRDKARRLLKLIEETPPRFSVYDMWEMNATTFISMLGLITSFIVTVLQFAFL